MRTEYRNGDEITLVHTGCNGCSPDMINGMLCHEHGCPDGWRDKETDCFECGCGFYAEEARQSVCQDCATGTEYNEEDLYPDFTNRDKV